MKTFIKFLSLVFLLTLSQTSWAQLIIKGVVQDSSVLQPSDSIYHVEMIEGTTFVGKVVGADSGYLRFHVMIFRDTVSLMIAKIKTMHLETSNEKGWFPNPNPTRYLFGPSALNTKKGTGYYQTIFGLFHSVHVAVTDYFIVGAGTEIVSLTQGEPLLMLSAKASAPVDDRLSLGVGTLAIVADMGVAGIAFGVATVGNNNSNASVGVGLGYFDGELSDMPIVTISGMHRLSKQFALITENWFLSEGGETALINAVSGGVRFFGEHMAVDVALITSFGEFDIPFLPYIDFVYSF